MLINSVFFLIINCCNAKWTCNQKTSTDPNPSEKISEFEKLCDDNCDYDSHAIVIVFQCSGENSNEPTSKCICKLQEVADDGPDFTTLYNYVGSSNCSFGQFGLCGERNNLTVGRYPKELKCIKGRCMDPKKLISNKCETCGLDEDCATGLACSDNKCIPPKSLPEDYSCSHDNACMDGLVCYFIPFSSSRTCKRADKIDRQ